LTGPKLYLAGGRILPGIDIPHLNFPSLFEMLFMLGLAVRGEVTAKLLHFGFGLLLAGLVFAFSRKHLQLKSGWLAVVFLFSMPMVLTLGGWAYNDLALAFYQVAALYALLCYREKLDQRGQNGWLILSGLCCGLAMSLKYTSFVAPLTLVGLLIWWHWQEKRSFKALIRSVLIFGLVAGLIACPWYLKNWLFTGNPVYPFVFGGQLWDDYRSAAYSTAGSGVGFDPGALLLLPIQLTLGYKDANYIDGRSGPLFLAFLPLILLYGLFSYRRKPAAMKAIFIFVLAQYLFWIFGVIWSSGLWQSSVQFAAVGGVCALMGRFV
jgi:4-amino-4-deoxy-L-arabinose transferase-like glycosyltransferase